jgi:hypothetical protein
MSPEITRVDSVNEATAGLIKASMLDLLYCYVFLLLVLRLIKVATLLCSSHAGRVRVHVGPHRPPFSLLLPLARYRRPRLVSARFLPLTLFMLSDKHTCRHICGKLNPSAHCASKLDVPQRLRLSFLRRTFLRIIPWFFRPI